MVRNGCMAIYGIGVAAGLLFAFERQTTRRKVGRGKCLFTVFLKKELEGYTIHNVTFFPIYNWTFIIGNSKENNSRKTAISIS